MGLLHDLCRDDPLTGNYLKLFEALEEWEATSDSRGAASETVGEAARAMT
jgi:hypothetical protein